jgi:predicted ATPase
MQAVKAALAGAEETDGLSPEDVATIAGVFEEACQLHEKLLAIQGSIGTGKIRISRLPPEPTE